MNQILSTTLLLGAMCVGPVLAQTAIPPPATTPPAVTMAPAVIPPAATMAPATTTVPPAVTANGVNTTPGAPVAGANSFTMSQAQSRLQDHGFTQVSELVKDDKSVWRGHAMKDGKTVGVAVDYQGNITAD
jgi:hypothetical protein